MNSASSTSTRDVSSGHRGGRRSRTNRAKERTGDQHYSEARNPQIEGRWKMSTQRLQQAIACA
ncbi:MAG TPA: hypothetical protein VND98_01755 [Solirubrobacterales bacterium]|nr:hypothetical protein [Solirubrobacterales bacterium]